MSHHRLRLAITGDSELSAPAISITGTMDDTRKDALIYIADLSAQLSDLARRNEFEIIAALLATVVARANALLSEAPTNQNGPLN